MSWWIRLLVCACCACIAGVSSAEAQRVSLTDPAPTVSIGMPDLECHACNRNATHVQADEPTQRTRLAVEARDRAAEREANRREAGRPIARIAIGLTLGLLGAAGASLVLGFTERFTSRSRVMQPDGTYEEENSFAPGWGLLCLAGLVALAGGILFASGMRRAQRLARQNRLLEAGASDQASLQLAGEGFEDHTHPIAW